MKKNSLIAFSAVAFSVLAAGACATEHPAYIKFGVGASMISGKTKAYGFQGNTTTTPNPFVSTNLVGSKSQTNYGTNAEIAIGHSFFHPNIRTELAYMRLMDQDDAFDIVQLKRKSDTTTINIYYDFINQSKFTPYIGLLLGYGTTLYAFNGLNTNSTTWPTSGPIFDASNGITNPNIDASAMTYQTTKNTNRSFVGGVKLGVAYKINNNMTFEVDYSIRNLAKAETVIPTNATYAATTTPGAAKTFYAPTTETITSNVSGATIQPFYVNQTLVGSPQAPSVINTPAAGEALPNIQTVTVPAATATSVVLTEFTVPATDAGTPVAATFKSPRYLNSINMGIRLTF